MIETILFDADGVLQRPAPQRRAAWQRLIGPDRKVDEFLAAVFAIERPGHEGSDFVQKFSDLVVEWRCEGTIQDALAAWTMIEPDPEMAQVVRALRRAGLRCCLATNQEPHRAAHMSEHLGYSRLFDREFYSCRMGVAKPSTTYFRSIVDELGVVAEHVLFLDDREDNVAAAQQAGLHAAQFLIDSGPAHLTRTLAQFGVRFE